MTFPHSGRARLITLLLVSSLLLLLAGCGGGGGGGNNDDGGGNNADTVVRGIVLDSANADRGVGDATVTIGGQSAVTTNADNASEENPVGSFVIQGASVGASVATVTPPRGGAAQTLGFSPAVRSGEIQIELILNIGQVTGRVLGPDGQAVEGAFVTVLATGESIQTGADGRFRADLIPAGETQLFSVFRTASATTTVTIGNGLTDVGDIRLTDDPRTDPPGQPTTIQGTVRLSDNGAASAAAGITVLLKRNGVQVEQTLTDGQGNYSFYRPAGTYELQFIKIGYRDAVATVTLNDPSSPVTVPNVTMERE